MKTKHVLSILLVLGGFETALGGQQAPEDGYCLALGKVYGRAPQSLDDKLNYCFQWAANKARGKNRLFAQNKDKSVQIFGFNNLIFIRKDKVLTTISGEMSKLSDIQAVALSQDGTTVTVLDKYQDKTGLVKQQMLFFKTTQNGNVVPFSMNNDEIINEAQSVTLSAQTNEAFLLISRKNLSEGRAEAEIVSFAIQADSRSPLASSQPKKKEILKSTNSIFNDLSDLSHLSHSPDKNTLFIFDSNGKFAGHSY